SQVSYVFTFYKVIYWNIFNYIIHIPLFLMTSVSSSSSLSTNQVLEADSSERISSLPNNSNPTIDNNNNPNNPNNGQNPQFLEYLKEFGNRLVNDSSRMVLNGSSLISSLNPVSASYLARCIIHTEENKYKNLINNEKIDNDLELQLFQT